MTTTVRATVMQTPEPDRLEVLDDVVVAIADHDHHVTAFDCADDLFDRGESH